MTVSVANFMKVQIFSLKKSIMICKKTNYADLAPGDLIVMLNNDGTVVYGRVPSLFIGEICYHVHPGGCKRLVIVNEKGLDTILVHVTHGVILCRGLYISKVNLAIMINFFDRIKPGDLVRWFDCDTNLPLKTVKIYHNERFIEISGNNCYIVVGKSMGTAMVLISHADIITVGPTGKVFYRGHRVGKTYVQKS